jgi:hypothetical protein
VSPISGRPDGAAFLVSKAFSFLGLGGRLSRVNRFPAARTNSPIAPRTQSRHGGSGWGYTTQVRELVMDARCDNRGCNARALKELWLDNGLSLYFCGHHAAQHMPWLSVEERFSEEPMIITA